MTDKIAITIKIGSVGDQYHRDPKFKSLVDAIAKVDQSLDVQMPPPQPIDLSRRGLTWWELVDIIIPAAGGYLLPKILDAAVGWALDRIKDEVKAKPGAKGRPKRIHILGPDGEILKSVSVKSADEEPEDTTEKDKMQREQMERIKAQVQNEARTTPGLIVPKPFPPKRRFGDRLLGLFRRH